MVQIGIDIGHGRLKVVGLRRSFGGWSLVGAATVAIPVGVISQTGLANRAELTEALKVALKQARPHPIRSRRAISALPASAILTKLLELPLMPSRELARAIPFEAGQSFPVPIEELVIDWQVLRQAPMTGSASAAARPDGSFSTAASPAAGQIKSNVPPAKPAHATQDVLLVGAPKVLVDGIVDLFNGVGLELVALEIKPLANARATITAHDPGATLLVDIGAEDTALTVLVDGQIRHIATLKFGASGFVHQPTAKARRDAKTKKTTALDFLPQQLTPLAEEITHVAKFAEGRLSGAGKIRRVRLCGGGAAIPRLKTILERLTELPTELANPLQKLRPTAALTLDQALPLTTAIGLALRGGDRE